MPTRKRIAAAATLAAACLGAVAATTYGDPSGLDVQPVALATLDGPVRLDQAGIEMRTRGARDALTARLQFAAGGTTGWHTHPGPVIVQVVSGTLTVVRPSRHGCVSEDFHPGQGFIENGSLVHEVYAGDEPVVVYATFLGKPGTTAWLTPVAAPPGC